MLFKFACPRITKKHENTVFHLEVKGKTLPPGSKEYFKIQKVNERTQWIFPVTKLYVQGAAFQRWGGDQNRHRQLLRHAWCVIDAELGRKREKSKHIPVGMLSQFRTFGRQREVGAHSSGLLVVLFRAWPFVNNFDMWFCPPLAMMDISCSAEQGPPCCTIHAGVRAATCPALGHHGPT